MRLRPRTILTADDGTVDVKAAFYPTPPVAAKTKSPPPSIVERINAGEAVEETADLVGGDGGVGPTNEVISRSFYGGLLDEFIQTTENKNQGFDRLYDIYRDMYYFDSVSGCAVDMYSTLPFGDFSLAGIRDEKGLLPFEQSLENMNIRRFMPLFAVNFLVNGMLAAEMVPDKEAKNFVYKDIIPHDSKFVTIEPSLEFGRDPKVTVDLGRAIAQAAVSIKGSVPKTKVIDKNHLVFLIRQGLFNDFRGVSMFKRILPIWLFEKSIMRGTLDQASKRLRSIPLIQVGDEEWVPTAEEMGMLTAVISDAMLDPVGASIVTRSGVNITEFLRPDDFWKYTDISDQTMQIKLRGLGVNEAIISGDATLATIDAAMSVFIERLREFRSSSTQEIFYDRMFPTISANNDITRARYGQMHAKRARKKSIGRRETAGLDLDLDFDLDMSLEMGSSDLKEFDSRRHIIPQVVWHKKLRPEADDAYMQMLDMLEQKGVPIPLQFWAASGGIDLDGMVDSLDEDIQYRESIKDWQDKKKDFAPQEAEGGEFASAIMPVNPLARDYSRQLQLEEARANLMGDGKSRLSTAKGRKVSREKMHKLFAEAAAKIAQRENARDTVDEQEQRQRFGRKTYSYRKK